MKTRLIVPFLIGVVTLFSSCKEPDEAEVSITNQVHNVSLSNIYFADKYISYLLIPGEKASRHFSEEFEDIDFPIHGQVEFYMVKGNKMIYLLTEESFFLDANKRLDIIIDDNTRLISPAVGSLRSGTLNEIMNDTDED